MTHSPPSKTIVSQTPMQSEADRFNGVCAEAASVLAGRQLPARTVAALGHMSAERQMAAIGLMFANDNFSGDFSRALLAATPPAQRASGIRETRPDGVMSTRLAIAERKLIEALKRISDLSEAYNADLTYLAIAGSLARSWMCNDAVANRLRTTYPQLAETIGRIAGAADEAKPAKRPMKLPYGNESLCTDPNQGTCSVRKERVRKA